MTYDRITVLAWSALVLAAGWRWRPRSMPVLPNHVGVRQRNLLPPVISAPAGAIGRAIRKLGHLPANPSAEERLGLTVAAVAGTSLVWPPVAVAMAAASWSLPRLRQRAGDRRRGVLVADELPEVVDLLLLSAEAGLPALSAVSVVSEHCAGPVGCELARAHRQVALGLAPDDAFARAADEVGEPMRPLTAALLASIREGTPLAPALERVGDEARRQRRRQAEQAARKVPLKLLFPLVLCTLPAFLLLTIVPLLASALGSLQA